METTTSTIYPSSIAEEASINALCQICSAIVQRSSAFDVTSQSKRAIWPRRRRVPVFERYPHLSSREALRQSGFKCHLCSLLYAQCPALPDGPLIFEIVRGRENENVPTSLKVECGIVSEYGHAGYLCVRRGPLEHLAFYRPDNRSWCNITTKSNATLALANKWLAACRSDHEICARQGTIPRRWPARLLLISASLEGVLTLRLEDRAEVINETQYLTLSYCWGDVDLSRLLRDDLQNFRTEIPLAKLPRTMTDAVDITFRLGFKAIWIDALCIVQDDRLDWEMHLPMMGHIYGNSVCTIAAVSGKDCHQGCYAERHPLIAEPCQVQTRKGTTVYLESGYAQHGLKEKTDMIRGRPQLSTRGWVVQERILSPRTLYFSSQGISWECCHQVQQEIDGEFSSSSETESTLMSLSLKVPFGALLRSGCSEIDIWRQGQWHERWWRIVENFTSCDLTVSSDRWPALSGAASILQQINSSPLIYGLWHTEMRKELLWYTRRPCDEEHQPHKPSWSWISTTSPVRMSGLVFDTSDEDLAVEILRLPKPLSNPDEEVDVALKVRAQMLRCRLSDSGCDPDQPRFGDHFAELADGELRDQVRQAVERRRWHPDICSIDDEAEVWALLCARREFGLTAMIVRTVDQVRGEWQRIGMLEVSWFDAQIRGESMGETRVIDLI